MIMTSKNAGHYQVIVRYYGLTRWTSLINSDPG